MRVLILSNDGGGLLCFRRELLADFVKNHEVYCCVPSSSADSGIVSLGCKVIPCNMLARRSTDPIKDLKLLRYYKRAIKNVKPDVVLTYTIKPNVYGGIACQSLKVPYIANVTGLGTTIENGGLLAKVSTTLYKIGLRKADCVFFQNKENQKLFVEKKIIKGKTRLIPGSGVNLDKHCLESYPQDKEGFHFLFVGRIMKDKGIEELLSAIRDIHNENKNVIADVVGFCDENYSDALKSAESEGAIVFHGVQSDVHPFYTNCHCAVLPSYHEGMANVMLEASSTGRPVITTRVPGCQETFDEGITGFGCDVKSAESLKEAMRKILSLSQSEREKMGNAARQKMIREYDRNLVLKAYKEEIEAVFQNMR